ncbi:hypothetical protein STEG23_002631, partial [Scotinomys teguina]
TIRQAVNSNKERDLFSACSGGIRVQDQMALFFRPPEGSTSRLMVEKSTCIINQE